jgi:four helix bundle protein
MVHAFGAGMSQAHEKLVAWQRADDLCVEIYRLTRENLPPSERYELSKQLRRAAYSVPANLAEGFATESTAIRAAIRANRSRVVG